MYDFYTDIKPTALLQHLRGFHMTLSFTSLSQEHLFNYSHLSSWTAHSKKRDQNSLCTHLHLNQKI